MKITLLGAGGGTPDSLTAQAAAALQGAQFAAGAARLLAGLPEVPDQARFAATKPADLLHALESCGAQRAVVAYSGDSGFYSGCRNLLALLRQAGYSDIEVLPGLSSVQLLAAALCRPWQDWRLVSAHGVSCDAVRQVMQGQPVLFLTGGAMGPAALCAQLEQAGLGALHVTVGENLSTPQQRLLHGTAAEFARQEFAALSVLLAEAAPLPPKRTPGWPDSLFLRTDVPMTKRFVRAAVLACLAPAPGETVWDVGAGTGSVSAELAAAVCGAPAFAVECRPQAAALTRQNRAALCVWNLRVVEGRAPQALADLPAPDAVFLGGSGGELDGIVGAVLDKNPNARICISAIALETLSAAQAALSARGLAPRVAQISVSESRAAGALHLLSAHNPTFLITGNCDG